MVYQNNSELFHVEMENLNRAQVIMYINMPVIPPEMFQFCNQVEQDYVKFHN